MRRRGFHLRVILSYAFVIPLTVLALAVTVTVARQLNRRQGRLP
jgi:hypothetical protein